jgi:hypothetical protein
MKWVLLIVGGLALLAAVMAAVGSLLPRDHHVTRKARFHVSPAALFAVLAGPPDGKRLWWEADTHGQKITYELVEAKPPERLVTRIAQPGLGFGGGWTFEIAPLAGGGSELRIHENGEIYNVMFRFMARYLFGYTGSIETYMRDLGVKFDEPVAIEA